MIGGTVGEVVASMHPQFAAGDQVVGMGGWQEYSDRQCRHPAIRKIDTSQIPISAYLGAVGMPGVTAWYGLNAICEAKAGQTIAVSAASGAVGSIVGQLAKAKGCRAVGFAGGPDKCRYVVDELGFDACIDYKAHADPKSLYLALEGRDAGRRRRLFRKRRRRGLRRSARAHERLRSNRGVRNDQRLQRRPDSAAAIRRLILTSRLRVQGFIVSEHMDQWPAALAELGPLVATGKLKYRETIANGLDAAPEAFPGNAEGKELRQAARETGLSA